MLIFFCFDENNLVSAYRIHYSLFPWVDKSCNKYKTKTKYKYKTKITSLVFSASYSDISSYLKCYWMPWPRVDKSSNKCRMIFLTGENSTQWTKLGIWIYFNIFNWTYYFFWPAEQSFLLRIIFYFKIIDHNNNLPKVLVN